MQINQGLRLVHSGSVTQANMKLASVDAGAMIDIGVDWSTYAGDDAGSTPHLLVLYDSAGKRMQGFIGASGGGETLGSELITVAADRDFSGGQGNWIIVAGTDITFDNVDCDWNASSWNCMKLLNITTVSQLCKYELDVTAYNSGTLYGYLAALFAFPIDGIATYSGYRTIESNKIFQLGSADFIGSIDNLSIKQITDISTNGVHLHSTKGGTDRNIASIDSSFDLNCVEGCDFKIYRCP